MFLYLLIDFLITYVIFLSGPGRGRSSFTDGWWVDDTAGGFHSDGRSQRDGRGRTGYPVVGVDRVSGSKWGPGLGKGRFRRSWRKGYGVTIVPYPKERRIGGGVIGVVSAREDEWDRCRT